MKIITAAMLILLVWNTGLTQKPYFQQEVHYNIDAKLNDIAHILDGNIEMEYINHAPDALSEIWIHLWGNAFKNKKTAFAKQKMRDGDNRFYFAKDDDLGYFTGLDFYVDGQKATWAFDKKNPDIAVIRLASPLASGGRIKIKSPFSLKIPDSFSRLGHVGTSYQMTQWYPKPAVYDHKGWHAMPYLDMGEFYSEFGSFDVSLTLPDNYVVGATGVLKTASELAFLQQKVEATQKLMEVKISNRDTFPKSSATFKTIRYVAYQVHDFAWFADKRFHVLKDTATLASGKKVDCWAMFANKEANIWKKGAFFVRRAVEFYDQHVGEYPWPHATAVHSALSAGGGMEYPMITVIGNSSNSKSLDNVITHEVGHNWFYGILASNEREHGFMDEGFNSYYEYRYMSQNYKSSEPIDLPKFLFDPAKHGSIMSQGQLMLAREHLDSPPDMHSNEMSQLAYGIQMYSKTGTTLHWLEQSLGTEKFDRMMKAYYETWKFKHPYPEDLKACWEKFGVKADWWFELMQTQKQVDYAITDVKKNAEGWVLEVENNGQVATPFSVSALTGDKVVTKWFEPGAAVVFPDMEVDRFVIDHDFVMLDVNRRNNEMCTKGLFKSMSPVKFSILSPLQSAGQNTISILPWLGWNNMDKTMIGLMLYNAPLPTRKFQYYIAPGYATGSKQLVGFADLKYRIFTKGIFPKITLGVSGKSFDTDYNYRDKYYTRTYRAGPQVRLELADQSLSFRHSILLRSFFLGNEIALRDTGDFTKIIGKEWVRRSIHQIRYEAKQKRSPNPWQMVLEVEGSQDIKDVFSNPAEYLKASVEWRQQFYYKRKAKVTARFFAGAFLANSRRNNNVEPTAFSLNPQGFNDYTFDHTFLARSGGAGILGRQVTQTQGGFKGAFGAPFGGVIGNSNNFILALNLKSDLPQKLPLGIPLKPYFDIGYFDDATIIGKDRPFNEQLVWSGGFVLEMFKGGLEIYLPLVNSKTLKRQYCEQSGGSNDSALFCGGNFLKMISWSVRMPFRDPEEALAQQIR